MLPHLDKIKFAFIKTGEDSLAYFYGRCLWESDKKCLPYKEYLVQSKTNPNYVRYQCYDLNTYNQLKRQIEATKVVQEIEGKSYNTVEGNLIFNYLETPLGENECGVTMQYMVELLRFK